MPLVSLIEELVKCELVQVSACISVARESREGWARVETGNATARSARISHGHRLLLSKISSFATCGGELQASSHWPLRRHEYKCKPVFRRKSTCSHGHRSDERRVHTKNAFMNGVYSLQVVNARKRQRERPESKLLSDPKKLCTLRCGAAPPAGALRGFSSPWCGSRKCRALARVVVSLHIFSGH
mgnify:CR=1 FL=1